MISRSGFQRVRLTATTRQVSLVPIGKSRLFHCISVRNLSCDKQTDNQSICASNDDVNNRNWDMYENLVSSNMNVDIVDEDSNDPEECDNETESFDLRSGSDNHRLYYEQHRFQRRK